MTLETLKILSIEIQKKNANSWKPPTFDVGEEKWANGSPTETRKKNWKSLDKDNIEITGKKKLMRKVSNWIKEVQDASL